MILVIACNNLFYSNFFHYLNSSTAYTHGRDFDHLLELKEFDKVVKPENDVKPIGMFFCDVGPDESQNFHKHLTLPYSIS